MWEEVISSSYTISPVYQTNTVKMSPSVSNKRSIYKIILGFESNQWDIYNEITKYKRKNNWKYGD